MNGPSVKWAVIAVYLDENQILGVGQIAILNNIARFKKCLIKLNIHNHWAFGKNGKSLRLLGHRSNGRSVKWAVFAV